MPSQIQRRTWYISFNSETTTVVQNVTAFFKIYIKIYIGEVYVSTDYNGQGQRYNNNTFTVTKCGESVNTDIDYTAVEVMIFDSIRFGGFGIGGGRDVITCRAQCIA
jgi:hypothetical protein